MSIGNLKDQGNKGNNYPYQLANLKLLGSISDSSTTANGTLLNILAAIQGGQNFATALVEDQGGVGCPGNCPVYTEVKIWNGTSYNWRTCKSISGPPRIANPTEKRDCFAYIYWHEY